MPQTDAPQRTMPSFARTLSLTVLAMIAFAGNSILCRLALAHTDIDAASFTTLRLASGALTLWLIVAWRDRDTRVAGNWTSSFALFAYAAAFSFAYISLSAATGALLLFGAVQATMIAYGLWRGERFNRQQGIGFTLAVGGLVGLLLPGLSAPPLLGAMLMLAAGVAWGVYSLRGRGGGDPTRVTAGNFVRALPFSLVLSLIALSRFEIDPAGVVYALLSGAIASGLGYAVWYTALRGLTATNAATVQLSVPVIAALAGVALLNEPITLRLVLASIAILGGVAVVILAKGTPR